MATSYWVATDPATLEIEVWTLTDGKWAKQFNPFLTHHDVQLAIKCNYWYQPYGKDNDAKS